jgi:hypothetical protein
VHSQASCRFPADSPSAGRFCSLRFAVGPYVYPALTISSDIVSKTGHLGAEFVLATLSVGLGLTLAGLGV